MFCYYFFFFFQAEDGIRDGRVTGVQTCALPIYFVVLCERIVVAQNDEIAFVQRWLREHNEFVPPADPRGHVMPGMDHPMLMPGMLTPDQMTQLDAARGSEFDRRFLRFMIQHHRGAIPMVSEPLSAPGAAQDGPVFRFAADVNADQTTEIDRMSRMLDALSGSPQ